MGFSTRPTALKFIAFVLLAIVLVRLLTLGLYPLGSTTEPRYAEIARKMLETGNWVTPWFDHGVPFWGKPPLSFWASAATMGVFGVNEFGVRLAPFLASLGCVALFWAWPQGALPTGTTGTTDGDGSFTHAWTLPMGAAVVFLSSVVGFIASAAVMTDMFMALGTTLCMVSFWVAVNHRDDAPTPWRWVFFVGLAIGLLAKGPVATVITGLALGLWLAARVVWGDAANSKTWTEKAVVLCGTVWQRLPWVWGILLTAALTLPWYLLAEQRTPGFLQYFIVGEHFQRFLVSGWTGDLYGQGHAEARGLIWWFGFGGFLPWSVVALVAWFGARRNKVLTEEAGTTGGGTASAGSGVQSDLGEHVYLFTWTIAPLVFFTSARNILEAYVLPGLAPFALLCALWVSAAIPRWPWLRRVWCLGLLCPVLWAGWLATSERPEQRSQRALLKLWQPDTPLVYLGARPLSANFYSRGQAQVAERPADIEAWMAVRSPVTLVLQDSVMRKLSASALDGWQKLGQHDGFTLLRRLPDTLGNGPNTGLNTGSNPGSNKATDGGKHTSTESTTR